MSLQAILSYSVQLIPAQVIAIDPCTSNIKSCQIPSSDYRLTMAGSCGVIIPPCTSDFHGSSYLPSQFSSSWLCSVYNIPFVHAHLAWRIDNLRIRIQYAINPPEQVVFQPQEQAMLENQVNMIVNATLDSPGTHPHFHTNYPHPHTAWSNRDASTHRDTHPHANPTTHINSSGGCPL